MSHLLNFRKSFNFKKILVFLLLLLTILWIYFFVLTKPSNNRNWEAGMDILPQFSIAATQVNIQNVRDFRFADDKTISSGYINRSVDATKITQVWFVQEPFTIKPFTGFKGVAHTYFVFDFSDQEPIVVSVEARREQGEAYDAFKGLFNKYELIYIWGTEQDETTRRVILEKNQLFMYPLQISQAGKHQLFLQMAETSHDLEKNPRFYNTLTSNCTNELAKAANKVKSNAIPFNRALFFPGYSDQELYKLGFIPHDLSIEQEKQKYNISDLVRTYYNDPNFSQQLRLHLATN